MFCRNCGSEISANASVCPYCGVPTDNSANNYAPAQKQGTNTLAIVGFVFSFLITIVGLICSIIGLVKAKEYGGNGKGLAIAGIIISVVTFVLTLVLEIVVLNNAMTHLLTDGYTEIIEFISCV